MDESSFLLLANASAMEELACKAMEENLTAILAAGMGAIT